MQKATYISLLSIALLSFSCTVPREGRQLKKSTKEWRQSPPVLQAYNDSPLGGTVLTLRENNKFEITSSGFFTTWFKAGSWTIKKDIINLIYLDNQLHPTGKQDVYIDRNNSVLVFKQKDPAEQLKLKIVFSQSDTATVQSVATPYAEYAFYQDDSLLQNSVLSYNYSNLWDLDGDGVKDTLLFIGNGGAHTFFRLRIVLSSDGLVQDFPWIQIDLPYLSDIETLKKKKEHPAIQFVVHDFDSNGTAELYFNLNNAFSSIPPKWEKQGVNSRYILMDFSEKEMSIKNYNFNSHQNTD